MKRAVMLLLCALMVKSSLFLQGVRVVMLIWIKPFSLIILLGWSSLLSTSLMIEALY